jgi:uncharacterized protein with GYD domain
MPTYAVLFNWTEQGVKNYKDSPSRAAAATEAMAQGGVRLRDLYWTVGPYDLVGIFDADSEEAATAALLALGAQGNVRTTTMRAFSSAEFEALIG